ncbi:MAG TPA: three-Cys-motif partner protein TcmP [Chthonomonadales bacterium]|nr:three-Cys-motif partner protein TcmP [Chthonomonadales bacterium]
MATPKETMWPLQPHTAAKHEILRRYLGAWFPIVAKVQGRILYIDGFAGPGRYSGGEPGSPLIALETAAGHVKLADRHIDFWFIDEDDRRVENLRKELSGASYPSAFRVHTELGRFDRLIDRTLNECGEGAPPLGAAFAFIDPFGISGVPFHVIERLLRRPKAEVLVSFMVDSINRFKTSSGTKVTHHIREVLGVRSAQDMVRIADLDVDGLRDWYAKSLTGVARFVRMFGMRDKRDRRVYYLYFATNHSLGHEKMKEAMWRVDPSGSFAFSDATNPDQLVLFNQDPAGEVALLLRKRYGDGTHVHAECVREFVVDQTAYLAKHCGAALKELEREGRIAVEPRRADGSTRTRGTFPVGTVIRWVSAQP